MKQKVIDDLVYWAVFFFLKFVERMEVALGQIP